MNEPPVPLEVLEALGAPLAMAKELTEQSMGVQKQREDCSPDEIRARGVWHALHYLERRLTGWTSLPSDIHQDYIDWERQTQDFEKLALQNAPIHTPLGRTSRT